MKKLLRTLLILLIVGGLIAGGVYGYSRYTMSQPVQVQPVSYWLLDYSPNQTYLGGSVISGESLTVYGQRDRKPLEIFVEEGQQVRVGEPLLRYDITQDSLELDEKLLARQKLYDHLELLYGLYKRYAYVDYDRTIPTATPTFTPTPKPTATPKVTATPRTEGALGGLGVTRLSAAVSRELIRIDTDGDGSEGKPFRYRVCSTNNVPDPIPESLLTSLQSGAAHQAVHAWFETEVGYLYLRFLPPETVGGKGTFCLTGATERRAPTSFLNADSMHPTGGSGTLKDPYIFSYTEGSEVPGAFFARYSQQASALGKYIYAELQGSKITVAVDFTSMGTCILRLKATPQVTPSPSPTPTPTPSPTPTPTPTPTATPEGWEDTPATPYVPNGGGMSRAERLAYVQQLVQQIRDEELSYRQLCHDIDLLVAKTGQNGTVFSTFTGVVSLLKPDARTGEILLEVRGGSGRNVIRCLIGETELTKYPVGTELTGFDYDIGDNVTARVTYVGNMPVTDNYSNGGNPNSSGYIMLLEAVGDVELPLYSYVEFTSFEPLSRTGTIYLYEAFVREIDGQDCIFIVRDGFLKKVQVHTGRRAMEYIELVGSDLTPEDLIAFPYGKNIRDGAPVEVVEDLW